MVLTPCIHQKDVDEYYVYGTISFLLLGSTIQLSLSI